MLLSLFGRTLHYGLFLAPLIASLAVTGAIVPAPPGSILHTDSRVDPDESTRQDPPVRRGLILDLDADRGIAVNDSGQVLSWENQSPCPQARSFTPQDEGRAIPGSGRPSLKKNRGALNGHNSVVFREQELLNRDEDAFDHLITGSGYTFFCVVAPYRQDGKLADVNSFFGNLRNGGLYEGIWGGFADDNRVWAAPRNGLTFGRWDANNPFLINDVPLEAGRYYVVMGRMAAGTDSALVELMINEWMPVRFSCRVKVNPNANASKMSIGQERDATQHPGVESFDGEMARFLLYERPLTEKEMKTTLKKLKKKYNIR